MLAKVFSGAILGVNAYVVDIEVDNKDNSIPFVSTVGLPDSAVKESKERVKSAIRNSGYPFPDGRVTINLAPAWIKKDGTAFDLPISLGILLNQGIISPAKISSYIISGELSLSGRVRPVRGILPIALEAKKRGFKGVIVPSENGREASIMPGIEVIPVSSLKDAVNFMNNGYYKKIQEVENPCLASSDDVQTVLGDMKDVIGQEYVKRAIEVAVSGNHNILMIGPPGSGKTMIARRVAGILPDMSFSEIIETTKIYSVAGKITTRTPLITQRPFRAPHHTISDVGLIGGGSFPKPGEVSLAHNGVLYLDELPEFKRNVLEVLRQPLEDGIVTVVRARMSVEFPARFLFIATMNPCPCGYLGDPKRECRCSATEIMRYRSKISGPLIDRIDIQIEVPRVEQKEIVKGEEGECSKMIRERVKRARERAKRRFESKGLSENSNSMIPSSLLKEFCKLDGDARGLLFRAMERLGLSMRAHDKILKVARTIADMDDEDTIRACDIAEAIQYRVLDRGMFR